MNRTDRLLAMVLELQGREWTRGAALAQQFGISLRTVYRDMLALGESGVPVISLAGRGYQLMPGYFLPPLHFTPHEASMLSFGLDAVRGVFDAEYARAADTAAQKLRAALPESRRQDLDAVRGRVKLVEPLSSAASGETLGLLRRALLERRVVTLSYFKPDGTATGSVTVRRLQPQSLARVNGVWLLRSVDLGFGEARTFRVDRIRDLHLTDEIFERGELPLTEPERELKQTFVLRFPLELEQALRERPSFFQTEVSEEAGSLQVTLRARNTESIWPWVLSWGAAVRVLAPSDLRERQRAEARAMLEQF